MEEKLTFSFDKEGDILDISIGRPREAIAREIEDDFFVMLDPKTENVVGFSILNFEKWFLGKREKKSVPIKASFSISR